MTAQHMTTTRDRVSLVKPCRAHGCTLLPRPDRVRLCTPHAVIAEQRIALGDLAHHIARRLGTTYADVLLVGDAMDAAVSEARELLPCGTHAAYVRHRNRGERCVICIEGERQYNLSRPPRKRSGKRRMVSPEQATEIRRLHAAGVNTAAIAVLVGVHIRTVVRWRDNEVA